MAGGRECTVSDYLITRLAQCGVGHIFGVPGDFVLGFMARVEASDVELVCACSELNAGYAADGYGRLKGLGAACVTYGVGGYSLLNAVVGSYAERVPVVVISGGPSLSHRANPYLIHHTTGDMNLQYRIYEEATVSAVILTDPEQAPRRIDECLTHCLRKLRPVYIEIPIDVAELPCAAPGPWDAETAMASNPEALEEAAEEAARMLRSAANPMILAGVEAKRMGIEEDLADFVTHAGYPFATTILGKAVVPERHPQFTGVYCGKLIENEAAERIESADVLLCLGTLMTDMNLGVGSAQLPEGRMILANSDRVRIKFHRYDEVGLADFMRRLRDKLPPRAEEARTLRRPPVSGEPFRPEHGRPLTHDRLYQRLQSFLRPDHVLIVDTGDSMLSACDLDLPDCPYLCQAFYASIGYALPAALGAGFARPEMRPVVIIGDGAFQQTATEMSSLVRHGMNPVILLINNDGYAIERIFVDGAFNDLHMWNYAKAPEFFGGGWGCVVKTEEDLDAALGKAEAEPDTLAFLEIRLPRDDISENLRRLRRSLHGGE